ncbi:MAG: EAL domain-containing protein [Gallionella sp.]
MSVLNNIKPLMMALSILTVSVLVFMFFKAKPIDTEKHQALASHFQALQMYDIALGATVSQYESMLFHNYDTAVSIINHIHNLEKVLQQYQNRGFYVGTPAYQDALKKLSQTVKQKSDLLEQFKSHNAIVKNSFHALPSMLRQLESATDNTDHSLHDLFENVLQNSLVLGSNHRQVAYTNLAQSIEAVRRIAPNLSESLQKRAALPIGHAEIILTNLPVIRRLAAELSVSLGSGLMGKALETAFNKHHAEQQFITNNYRFALLFFALLMLSRIFYSYWKATATNHELRIAAITFEMKENLVITDAKKNIVQTNRAFTQDTLYEHDDVLGTDINILNADRHDTKFLDDIDKEIAALGFWEGEFWCRRKNGDEYPSWLTISVVKGRGEEALNYVYSYSDMTTRKDAEIKIQNMALYDSLTNLPNRRLLMDRLEQALVSSMRHDKISALIFMDVDHFKTLNDTLGHHLGDQLLLKLGGRLSALIRADDTVSRFGGDEFVILLDNLGTTDDIAMKRCAAICHKLKENLSQEYQLENNSYRCTVSMGVTLFGQKMISTTDLLKQADIAMYQAKKAGRNQMSFFDPVIQATVESHAVLEIELARAVERDQFRLFYQPQVNDENKILGVEALIRWDHPIHGSTPPNVFIPLAEKNSQILSIGAWVLNTACAQLKRWESNPHTCDLTISINVSARQFGQNDFYSQVKKTIQQHAINPAKLKLELTESTILEDVETTIETMNALRELGIEFSMDDFGTGYSSLQYLKLLPLSQLKIDQSFIRTMEQSNSDRAIIATIIAMAHALSLHVIAEGVETGTQKQQLLASGCVCYQGYHFSKPLPIEELEVLLIQGITLS